jgi:anti-anti-sigma factor
MDFKLSTRRADSVFIVDLAGKITAGEALTALRQTIRDEVAKGHNRILLNLKDVSYVDSSGLGELIMALGTVTQMICAKCGATMTAIGTLARNAKARTGSHGASLSSAIRDAR